MPFARGLSTRRYRTTSTPVRFADPLVYILHIDPDRPKRSVSARTAGSSGVLGRDGLPAELETELRLLELLDRWIGQIDVIATEVA